MDTPFKLGQIVTLSENGKKYQVKHIHPIYFWIEAVPYMHNGMSIYNKSPNDFEELNEEERKFWIEACRKSRGF